MFRPYNPNPVGALTDDCTARALTLALGVDWDTAFFLIAINAAQMGTMTLQKNAVWWSVLRQHGFSRRTLPETCPDCYTVADFCADHPRGVYVIGTDEHVVTAVDGDWYDTDDSGGCTVLYYWYMEEE